jgi:hypothetical protein
MVHLEEKQHRVHRPHQHRKSHATFSTHLPQPPMLTHHPLPQPDGEYLVRSEHIAIHGAHDKQAEFYYSCAQIKVQGGKGNSVPKGVKIPGVYQINDKAINFSVWGSATTYPTLPGPAVAAGGRTTGSIDGKTTGTRVARRAVMGGSLAVRAAAEVGA